MEVIIWVTIGGRGTLIGAIIGALLINLVGYYTSGVYAEGWLFIMGILFVVSVLALPEGVVNYFQRILTFSIKKSEANKSF